MEYLLVVYFLMGGVWVNGAEIDGWGAIAYPTEAACLERKVRAEEIQVNLKRVAPHALDKRYACEPRETGPGGSGSNTVAGVGG